MKIAIVDDAREDREQLSYLLEGYCAHRSITAEIAQFSSGDELLKDFHPGQFQCVFLDIYMEGTDGMETAREIYRRDPACRLIFCTVSISHAVTSYEVRAAWYLTKPVSARRLADAMDHACLAAMHHSRTLSLHVGGTKLKVRFGDIYYMDCENRQARVHLRERTLKVDEPVSELMGRLTEDARFLMCNRSTLVNMDHVALVEDHDFRLKNGSCVPLRQRGRAALKREYLSWSLRELRQEERL